MKFYSEITHKNYDTEKECLAAEAEAMQKKTERQKDAEKIDKLKQKYIDAYDAYSKSISDFVQKYGTYKTTYKKDDWRPLIKTIDPFGSLIDFI